MPGADRLQSLPRAIARLLGVRTEVLRAESDLIRDRIEDDLILGILKQRRHVTRERRRRVRIRSRLTGARESPR